MATKFVGWNVLNGYGRLTSLVSVPRRKGSTGSGVLVRHNVDCGHRDEDGEIIPVVLSRFYSNPASDDGLQAMVEAVEQDRGEIFYEGYVTPNASTTSDSVFMNLNLKSVQLVGDQPSLDSEDITDDDSALGMVLASAGSSKPTPAADEEPEAAPAKPKPASKPRAKKAPAKTAATPKNDKPF